MLATPVLAAPAKVWDLTAASAAPGVQRAAAEIAVPAAAPRSASAPPAAAPVAVPSAVAAPPTPAFVAQLVCSVILVFTLRQALRDLQAGCSSCRTLSVAGLSRRITGRLPASIERQALGEHLGLAPSVRREAAVTRRPRRPQPRPGGHRGDELAVLRGDRMQLSSWSSFIKEFAAQ
mmetsp:Transcript_42748/g.118025  ORF Transcript_42748/g.118025 Transcript_42748/m.118025 type:complete len:177 (+) Transcript_42748:3346-3876(+)